MEIGKYHELKVLRETTVGLFLGNEAGEDVLLPNKFVDPNFKLDDMVNVLWQKFISKDTAAFNEQDEVDIMVLGESPLGYNCIVNDAFMGLAYANENFKEVGTGAQMKAYIKQVRNDGKLDLLFEKPGLETLEKHADKILGILRKNGQMSKKAFKRAIGNLYRNKFIELAEDGIKLIEEQ